MLGLWVAIMKELTLSIPEGYEVASFPEDITIKHNFGAFSRRYTIVDNSTIKYSTSLNIDARIIPTSEYADMKKLIETASREDQAQIILIKTQ
jgi:hypothetical protein